MAQGSCELTLTLPAQLQGQLGREQQVPSTPTQNKLYVLTLSIQMSW